MSNFRAGKQEITLWFVNSGRPFQSGRSFVVSVAIVSASFPSHCQDIFFFFKQLLLSKTQLKCCDIFCEAAFYLGFLAACGQKAKAKAAAGLT